MSIITLHIEIKKELEILRSKLKNGIEDEVDMVNHVILKRSIEDLEKYNKL